MSELSKKIAMKRFNAAKEGLLFLLSEEQVETLLSEAGITVSDWCLRGYHLARYNYTGNYEVGTCRFITVGQNQREKKTSDAKRAASILNMAIARSHKTPEDHHTSSIKSMESRIRNGTPISRKCEPGCTCGRHKNGGWNKGIPWKEWFPK